MTVVLSLLPVFLFGAVLITAGFLDSTPRKKEDPWVKKHYPNRADRSLRNWYMERELPPPPPASWEETQSTVWVGEKPHVWKGERPSHYVARVTDV